MSGAARPPSCPHSGLEEEACCRSSLSVLAVQHQANCSMPAQSIQCLARVRMKIATPTRQDWKRKNLAHTFPLRADFSSLSFFFPFFFLFFFFLKGWVCLFQLFSSLVLGCIGSSLLHVRSSIAVCGLFSSCGMPAL